MQEEEQQVGARRTKGIKAVAREVSEVRTGLKTQPKSPSTQTMCNKK